MKTAIEQNTRPARARDIGALVAELHYRAAELRTSNPAASEVLRQAAYDLERCMQDALTDRLPESVRRAIEYALSTKH